MLKFKSIGPYLCEWNHCREIMTRRGPPLPQSPPRAPTGLNKRHLLSCLVIMYNNTIIR